MNQNTTRFKPSGIEWLGEVPEHWKVSRAKFVSRIFIPQRNKPELNTEEGIPWLTMEDMQSKRIINTSFRITEEASKIAGSKILEKGSVIASCVGNLGISTVNDIDIIINQQLQAFIPFKSIIADYLRELVGISGNYFQTVATQATVVYVNQLGFANMPVLLPPKQEQKIIIDYLDRETTEIDALVAEKEQMISLLEEKRNALTNNAVTHGLDPNAPLKPSDLDWLGNIPQHWSVKKLGYLASLKSGETITADTIDKQGIYPVYGGNGLRGYTNSFTHSGDYVLIGRQGALCGNINYAHGDFWASEHAVVATPIEEYDYRWLGALLHTMNLNQYSLSAAQPGISIDRISTIKIPVPPLEEQRSIAEYIDREPTQIDSLITVIKDSIALLKERRSALITAAVTGQVKLEEMTV